ncbi:sodium:calcium antiporter [Citromicrobium sp. RCC1885]|uniref:calcium/sodium antiporter n=1 Tax=unclassified Citromicrobium TaxID=2630544 RepID=UPI0006C91578|nr:MULTISPECIES: calcium/sodium antiporter [unclassified Citromicrobium]KPM21778.1 sodium:calcium antiporter [Citromicrobium sp. RCC1885]KPM23591.1 sodium:calcium antiporter [Citromicrobium sp. RCC1878]MAO03366.1 sodium:calcium antiporter [Citromicrobium sp.]OAM06801.1 sodium:calcium antiporter [Citromicrobium sp. RCC1897]|tara:strand:- start:2416 stop:3393 length:978 start_codon:yes stop_codon:yes gene_type:complete
MTILLLIAGLVLLVVGGELLVRGAVAIAGRLGVSPLMIGLTIVGMGTSMPELAASVQAALAGSPGIALGNIVGSNIANSMLILGVAALLAPIAVARGTLWRDGGVGVLAAVALLALGLTTGLGRMAGLTLIVLMVGYLVLAYRQEKHAAAHSAAFDKAAALENIDPALGTQTQRQSGWAVSLAFLIAGLVCIVGGGTLLVNAAVTIAREFGMSETLVGLTIVAVGTSLPELVTSAVAALRKQSEVALGNVLGSNIYNVLFIGGVTGTIAPTTVPQSILGFDLPLLIAVSLGVMVLAWTGARLSRIEGLALVAGYALYIAFTAGLI